MFTLFFLPRPKEPKSDLGGRGREVVGREGPWLEGRILQSQWGDGGGDPPKGSWGQTHIWGLSSRVLWVRFGKKTRLQHSKAQREVRSSHSCLAISAATYRGAKCPTLKTAEKQPKHLKNSRKAVKTAVFRVFQLFFQLFFGCFTVTHSAPFSAVFRLFSMSGIWHLCRWPRRLQFLPDLFSRRFREGISFPNFVERSILNLPLSKLCTVHFALQNRAKC